MVPTAILRASSHAHKKQSTGRWQTKNNDTAAPPAVRRRAISLSGYEYQASAGWGVGAKSSWRGV